MAEKRDFLDDIIDIQRDIQAVSNPFGGITDTLAGDPSKVKVYNPADYKERPRPNSVFCLRVASKNEAACDRCQQVCPVDALELTDKTIKISDACRKCGLCSMACPTEALVSPKVMAKNLYDKVTRVASAYEQCYVTCTRALKRMPKPNEIVVACVGAVPAELWFSALADFDNVSVYLPLGICDCCRTTTGEEAYVDQIGQAEEWTGRGLGLEVDEKDLNHEQTRAYKRAQFMSSMAKAGTALVATQAPVLAGAQAIAKRVQDHSKQIYEMQRSLERMVGEKTTGNRRRILTQKRKSVLGTVQQYPALARRLSSLEVPACDPTLCTMCGECVKTCPQHACDLDASGRFSVEAAYCVNCGACVTICPEQALRMVPCNTDDLVVVDEEAERKRRAAEKQKAKIAEAKEKSRATLKKGLDVIEHLADE